MAFTCLTLKGLLRRHKQYSEIPSLTYCSTLIYTVEVAGPNISFDQAFSGHSVSDPAGMTDDRVGKFCLTPAGDSWLSAVLYLLSLWGSHWRSLGIFIPPECKCPAFAQKLQRSERGCSFNKLHEPLMHRACNSQGLFFSISGHDYNSCAETKREARDASANVI